jgi:hypothetical protein
MHTYTRYELNALLTTTGNLAALADFPEPPDELWTLFADNYYVSNYGLVLNAQRLVLMPWRRYPVANGYTYLVTVDASSLYVGSVVYAAFVNGGELVSRSVQLQFKDGNSENVKLSNLYTVPRTYSRDMPIDDTLTAYIKSLNEVT